MPASIMNGSSSFGDAVESAPVIVFESNFTNLRNLSNDANLTVFICGNIASVICLIGILANMLNIIVLIRIIRKQNSSTSYHILLALGIADFLSLLFYSIYSFTMFARPAPLLWQDISEANSDFEHLLMRIWYFPVNIFTMASNWCVVSLTVVRFLAVVRPINVGQWCTITKIRIMICVIYVLSVLINVPDWLTVGVRIRADGRLRGYDTHLYNNLTVYYSAYQVVETLIPFVVNSILVIIIIRNLVGTRQIEESLSSHMKTVRDKEHRRIGLMLASILLLFLVCYTPTIIYYVLRDYTSFDRTHNEADGTMQSISAVVHVFTLFNDAGNVFLFCLVNKHYRVNIKRTLQCRELPDGRSHFSLHKLSTKETLLKKPDTAEQMLLENTPSDSSTSKHI